MTIISKDLKDKAEGAALVAVGTTAGAGASAVVGGMGLVGGFGGVAIGMAPVAAAGAVVGSAAYGAKKAIEEGDAKALGAVAGGVAAGAGVAATVGGMGLAVGGTAVAVGAAPVVAAGAVVGLAAYGLNKLFKKSNVKTSATSIAKNGAAEILEKTAISETSIQAFERMEKKILQMEADSAAKRKL